MVRPYILRTIVVDKDPRSFIGHFSQRPVKTVNSTKDVPFSLDPPDILFETL
jgi:hypothetical protein